MLLPSLVLLMLSLKCDFSNLKILVSIKILQSLQLDLLQTLDGDKLFILTSC